jgi:UDP-N-acetylglucosamine 1-carboxyvinyltransferase
MSVDSASPRNSSKNIHSLTISRARLSGIIQLSGAKNAALRHLAASLLTDEAVTLTNYPASLLDAQIHVDMLEVLGKHADLQGDDRITLTESAAPPSRLDWTGRSIRNTLLILGALVARTGAGAVPLPGGCKLGDRQYDLHVMLLERLGAEVWEEGDMLCAAASRGLTGADIHLRVRSTGATENALLTGCLARGVTRIWNPHIRPEILDLIALLRKMGARIRIDMLALIAKVCDAVHEKTGHRMEPEVRLVTPTGSVKPI